MLKKVSKRFSLFLTLLLLTGLAFSSVSAVIAETTTEAVVEEPQLIKSPEESLPEAPPVLDIPETTNEELEKTDVEEAPIETQEVQEGSEETDEPVEIVEEPHETTENIEDSVMPEKGLNKADIQSMDTGDFTVEGGTYGENYVFEAPVLKFLEGGSYRVSGTTTEDRIIITAENVLLTLDSLEIDVSANYGQAAISVESGASATIDLVGENKLQSGNNCAGLQNNNDTSKSLVITSSPGNYQGYAGSLEATGGNRGAGIGGTQNFDSAVEINGGLITAISTVQAAGIGGGSNKKGTVTINDGIIIATGGKYGGAGIGGGGGANRPTGTVTINGGTITATGDTKGSDIGRGEMETYGKVIINGGNVKTSRRSVEDSIQPSPVNNSNKEVKLCDLINVQEDADILVDDVNYNFKKSHENAEKYYLYVTKENHTITVKKGNQQENYLVFWNEDTQKFVLWESELIADHFNGVTYSDQELILSGNNQTYEISMYGGLAKTTKDRIKITGTNVTVKLNNVKIDMSSKVLKAALLIESNASATINLAGENELKGGSLKAGLQNDNETEESLIIESGKGTIQGYAGSLTATGSSGGAGIGGANNEKGTVTITGGNITAIGSSGGSGIGGGNNGTGTITIRGGKITATGDANGSGIGGGGGKTGTVTIEDGDITATSTGNGSGIGGGSSGNGTVIINEGKIAAIGGIYGGSGIGGGSGGTIGTVTINGGKITATGQNSKGTSGGSGIGGGSVGVGVVTITGGTVTATGGPKANGIGRGQNGAETGGKVTISGGSVKALVDTTFDSIYPRPQNVENIDVALCNLIPFEEESQILVDNMDYQVNGLHKEDDKAYLYMMKENHTVTVITNGQQKNYTVIWDEQANKFILWESDLMVDNFTGVSYSDNEVILAGNDETYNLSMRSGVETTTKDRIKVTGTGVTVRLNDVKIDLSGDFEKAAFRIDAKATAIIDLVGENQLKSARHCAGLQNDNFSKSSLVINSGSGDYQGYAGSLEAQGGSAGAGIGGGNSKRGWIEIHGGLITAAGGYFASGIGGGNRDTAGSSSGKVTITGGVIIAKSGTYAAAIGGGYNGSGIVSISGGTITAAGNDSAPGIGDGDKSKDPVGEVTITGGSVKASAKKTPINPSPTSDGTTPLALHQADASSYTDGSTLKVGTTDWKVSGKHIDDNHFYLYLPKEKHVVTVANNESFIEWKEDKFVPASTYKLTIPTSVTLEEKEKKVQIKLTNEFYRVAGYTKKVSTSLSAVGMSDNNLILKNQADDTKQAHSLITYTDLTLPSNSVEKETDMVLGSPTGTTGNDPLQAGSYKGTLIFETTRTTEEVEP